MQKRYVPKVFVAFVSYRAIEYIAEYRRTGPEENAVLLFGQGVATWGINVSQVMYLHLQGNQHLPSLDLYGKKLEL